MSHWVMALQCPLLLSDSLFPGIFRNQQIRSRGVLVQNGHSLCVTWSICQCNIAVAETWRRIWGDATIFFRPKISEWGFFGKNFWWPFFSYRPSFSDFPFLFPDFPCLYYDKYRILPFPHKKNTFLLLYSYFHTHPTTLLLKILGGPMHGPSPTSNLGGPSPVPLGLRPCNIDIVVLL